MSSDLKGKGLFAFSDPGGAKAILAIAQELKDKGLLSGELIISDRQYDFFSDFHAEVIKYELQDEIKYISLFQPDFIVTGTSYSSNIELKFIEKANERSVKTIAFIDHWTNFYSRFEWNSQLILPTQIWVIDQRAKDLAIADNLPPERVVISGNPYYTFLSKWKPGISRMDFFRLIGIPSNATVILYAPEPLSQVNGREKFGFDELEVLERIIAEIPEGFWKDHKNYLLIKIHPNQNRSSIQTIVDKSKKNIRIIETDVHANTLIVHADLILGLFSNFLIEAKILGAKVFRFLPFSLKEDPFPSAKFKIPIIKNLASIF